MPNLTRFRNLSRVALVVLAAIQFLALSVNAQQTEPDEETTLVRTGPLGNFHVGPRIMVLMTPMHSELSSSAYDSQSSPALATLTYSNNAKQRLGGGVALQIDFTPKLSMNTDFLIRHGGYDGGVVVTTQTTGNGDATSISGNYERTRADFFDIPLTLRYYRGPSDNQAGTRMFFAGGVSLRRVSGVQTFNEQIDSDGFSNSNTATTETLRDMVQGATGGLGWQIRKQGGMKLDIELRYTRWLDRIFDTPAGQSNQHQMDLAIGFIF